jgi:signal transduction histidine kinase
MSLAESLEAFFSSRFFMPHGHCYLWKPALVWIQVLSNALIGLAYFAISGTLAYLVSRVRDLPFKAMYLAFGVFIVTCGITHFFDVYVIWYPAYWLDGSVRIVTALASVGTALLLPPLVPKALALARGAQAAHARGIQLETAVRDLGTMYERTRELERLKTEFFANVSHELRTPLTLILGPLHRQLGRAELDPEARRDLEAMDRNARTLLKHVNDLLDLSKLEAGAMAPVYSPVDLAHLVRLTAGHFETVAADRKIAFVVEAPQTLSAEVDADKIQRVLLNLLSNAFKFTPGGGRVRCTLSMEDGHASLEVADSGPGIPRAQREVVFERFRQLDGGATRRVGGTGLGLAIARDFVALHGGRIKVEDAREGGAAFRVRLPLSAPRGADVVRVDPAGLGEVVAQTVAELETRPSPASPVAATPPAAASGPRARVLVVEDNADMARFVGETLAAEFEVEHAGDGQEGLERATAAAPDLVITDLMMPRLSGDELVDRLRAHPELRTVPVIVLTAKADERVRLRLLRGGVQDYLAKPFAAEELLARAANLVSMRRAGALLRETLASQEQDLERLAAQVGQQQRELRDAFEAVKAANEQAMRALQAKTDLVNLASHELRTPLTSLSLQVEVLRLRAAAVLTPELQGALKRVVDSSRRLGEVVDSLLEYARLERGRVTPEISVFSLADVARDVLSELQPQAEEKGLALELRVTQGLPALRSDARLVRLVLTNLVSNAVKFTERGRVSVSVTREGGKHRVEVSDSGPGIPPEHLPRLFEPFAHLEPLAGKHTPGLGLGLSIVKSNVEVLGGRIIARSQPGEGSTFVVEIPGPDLAP